MPPRRSYVAGKQQVTAGPILSSDIIQMKNTNANNNNINKTIVEENNDNDKTIQMISSSSSSSSYQLTKPTSLLSSSTSGIIELTDAELSLLDDDENCNVRNGNRIDDDSNHHNNNNKDIEKEPLSSSSSSNMMMLSVEERIQQKNRQSDRKHARRVQNWKESPFAVGMTEVTWIDERNRSTRIPPDESGCLWCSAYVCPLFHAGRVGNMAILKSSIETIEIIVTDEETGQPSVRYVRRPKLDCIVGPYWPMLVCVTYPLIIGVSVWSFYSGIYQQQLPYPIILLWLLCTFGLIISLAMTACRDPGILYRIRNPPTGSSSSSSNGQSQQQWRWTDQADSYRPRTAWYDSDTGVIVDGFDHTCPWTGTAIGKKNMFSFQMFVCLVFVCMIMDIFILTRTIR